MIVVDTSAIVAILYREAGFDQFTQLITDTDSCFLSAVSYLEASMVMIGRGTPEAGVELDTFLERAGIEFVPFDHEQAKRARDAFARFGRGRHPARLNFGDCVAYALAQTRGLPLLYKGEDFAQTDVVSAIRKSSSG